MSKEQKIVKRSEIKIAVGLNEEKHPVTIEWQAEDSGLAGMRPGKAFMFSIWDKQDKSTMRIDLWTPEMSVEEMQIFFYETMASMADTYERSTSDKELGKEMRDFARGFGRKVKAII